MSPYRTDEQFLAAFEDHSLPFDQWNHRSHVRVAFLYAVAHDPDVATRRMRAGIKSYNRAHRVPVSPTSGYHETITVGFMRLISDAVEGRDMSFADFERRCPDLFDQQVLLRFYSRDRIMSAAARSRFLEPDLAPLSATGLVTD